MISKLKIRKNSSCEALMNHQYDFVDYYPINEVA